MKSTRSFSIQMPSWTSNHPSNGLSSLGRRKRETVGAEIRQAIRKLTLLPLACPLAPESEQLGASIRHLIVGRYRVLFTVRGRTVTILHVSGLYTDPR